MSDCSDDDIPSPTESEFYVPEGWNAPQDDVRSFLASYYQNENATQNDVDDGLSIDNFYEYEPAFDTGDYVRIRGQQDSKWAMKNTMGSYWSKMPYRIIASRMGHGCLEPDDDEDKAREEYNNSNQINSIRNAEWLQGRPQNEIEELLDSDNWYYRLDMSGSTEFPLADAMWWAEEQLVFDAEAVSVKEEDMDVEMKVESSVVVDLEAEVKDDVNVDDAASHASPMPLRGVTEQQVAA